MASKITVPSGVTSSAFALNGSMYVNENAVVSDATINRGAFLYISSGGSGVGIKENGGAVSYDPEATVSFAPNTFTGTVASFSEITVHSGTTAVSTTLGPSGWLYIYSGGIADTVNVNSYGALTYIYNGGSADNVNLTSNAKLYVRNGGAAGNVSAASATVYVSNGGTVNNLTAGRFAIVHVSSGGSALGIKENGGAVGYDAEAEVSFVANTFSGAVASFSEITVHSGTTAVSTTLGPSGWLYIYSGGIADTVNVNSYGALTYIYNGGSADNVKLNSNAKLYVRNGGVAGNVSAASATVYVSNGGTVNNLTAGRFAVVHVSSGGSALGIKENGGAVGYDAEAEVSFVPNTFSGAVASFSEITVHSGTTAVATTLGPSGWLYIYSGGIADTVNVNSYGALTYIYNGGSADNVKLNSNAKLFVCNGGAAGNVSAASATVYVSNGGTVNNLTAGRFAEVYVSSGGSALGIKENGGAVGYDAKAKVSFVANTFTGAVASFSEITVHSGTTAVSTTLGPSGWLYIYSGGIADTVNVNSYGARTYIYDGGSACNFNLNSNAILYVSGGDLSNFKVGSTGQVIVNSRGWAVGGSVTSAGALYVSGGGGVADLVVSKGGRAYVGSDGWLTGKLTLAGIVSAYEGGLVDFDISGLSAGNTALINDLSLVTGAPTFTVTVSESQAFGTYTLAEGAANFTDYVAVINTVGDVLDWVCVGESGNYEDRDFTLVNNSDTLLLTVSKAVEKAPEVLSVTADLTALTNKNVTVTATYSTNTATKQYSLDNKTWQTYTTGVAMTNNGTVYFRGLTKSGKVSEVKSYTVSNIDKVAPAKPTAKADVTTLTNKDVNVTVTYSSDSVEKQYSLDNKTWKSYQDGLIFHENATVYLRGADAAGNVSDVTTFTVSNIDKVAPAKPTVKADVTTSTAGNVTVTATFSSDSAQKQYSTDSKTWKSYSSGVVMSANGTVYFRGIDAAGNISDVTSYKVSNITGTISLDGDTTKSDSYQIESKFKPNCAGFYKLSGSFGLMKGTVIILVDGKKVASGTLKSGVLVFNKGKDVLLDSTNYTIVVKNTDKGKTASAYSMKLTVTERFDKGDTTDNTQAKAGALAANQSVNAWVGYGDAVDWYKLGVNAQGGIYDLNLSGIKNNVRLTVYSKSGAKIKSVTASAKKPNIPLADLCLDNGSYAVIEAPKAAKAQNSDYALKLTEKATFNRQNNDWNGATVLTTADATFTGALTKAAGGDIVDYCDVSALGNLSFKTTAGKVKVSFYDTNKQAVKVAVKTGGKDKTAAAVSLASGKVDNFTIGTLPSSVKYLKIEAAGKTLNSYTIGKIA